MPTIDIPDVLEFTAQDAYAALERELNRQQQDVRRELVSALQTATERLSRRDMVPDDTVAAEVNALRDTLAMLRQQFVRIGRAEAEMAARKAAV